MENVLLNFYSKRVSYNMIKYFLEEIKCFIKVNTIVKSNYVFLFVRLALVQLVSQ